MVVARREGGGRRKHTVRCRRCIHVSNCALRTRLALDSKLTRTEDTVLYPILLLCDARPSIPKTRTG